MEYKHLPATSGIYCIINVKNNKIYYGQACKNKTIKNRVRDHVSLLQSNKHSNKHLQNAFNKHGKNSFKTYVVLFCSDEKLNYYENRFLKLWAGNDKICYNISCDAAAPMKGRFGKLNPFFGKTHSDELKKKISQRQIGKKLSIETRNKIGKSHKGKKRTDNAKQNMKSPFKGMTNEERYGKKKAKEIREKQKSIALKRFENKKNHPRFGKKLTKEQKEKIGKRNKGKLKGKKHHNYSSKMHEFIHNDGILEKCTQYELREKYNLTFEGVSSIVLKKRKSYKGWRIKE